MAKTRNTLAAIGKRGAAFGFLLMLAACGKAADSASPSAAPGTPVSSASASAAPTAAETPQATGTKAVQPVRVADRLFWKPPEGWVGDVMPFADNGKLELFYLQDWRNDAPGFHPIFRVTTSNLTDYAYGGEAIPFSEIGKQDLAIGTGSTIKVGDTYHFYYTGHNWMFPDEGKPKEAVMHAVSKDLKAWTKVPEDTFYAPEGYERNDFRDPFVIYNEKRKEYWMLVSARTEGRGVLAVFSSKDMKKWQIREPLEIEDTDNFFMLECADIFQMGDAWYLVFSEFSDKGATHYRTASSLEGPWKKPEQDLFDGKGFYAAKSAAQGDRRFLFGWVPTRQGGEDYMKWDWAGNLVTHELARNGDGTLSVKLPEERRALFGREQALEPKRQIGSVSGKQGEWTLEAGGGLSGPVFDALPATALITGTVRFDEKTEYTGLVVGVKENAEKAYGVRLEPGADRLRYDAAPTDVLGTLDPAMQTPVQLEPGKDYPFEILIENEMLSFYINNQVALTTRIYKMPGGAWGWYSFGGTTVLKDLKLSVPAE